MTACKYIWKTLGEIKNSRSKVLCVDSKNITDMLSLAIAGIVDYREGFDDITFLIKHYPNVRVTYINRFWNKEADWLARQGRERSNILQ